MKNKSLSFRQFALATSLLTLIGCSNSNPQTPMGDMMLLGSYGVEANTATGEVNFSPLSTTPEGSGARDLSRTRAYLGWPESLPYNGPSTTGYFMARPVNCSSATFNEASRTLSVQFAMRSLLSNSVPECASPGSQDFAAYCACDAANPLNADFCNTRILGPLEVKVYYYEGDTTAYGSSRGVFDESTTPETYVGSLARTDLINMNHDFGCSTVSAGPCFQNDSNLIYTTGYPEYKTVLPGWDMGSLLNSGAETDFDLDPGELSGCKVMQFFYDNALLGSSYPNNTVRFYFEIDVLGFNANYGTFKTPPTVSPAPPSRTSSSSVSISANIDTAALVPADRLRVSIGSTEMVCINGDPCDSGGATNVTMSVPLDLDSTNRLYVHQGNGTNQSPAAMYDVIQDSTDPEVLTVSPANGATNVSIGSNVVVTFDEAIDPATITTTTFKVTQTVTNLCTTVSLSSDGLTATCTHTSNFPASTTLTVTVVSGGSGVKDLTGNALLADHVTTFTTGSSDSVRPTVDSVSPPNNAADFPINGAVTVTFSEQMKTSTITTSSLKIFSGTSNNCPPNSLTEVTSSVSLSGDQLTATITPSSNLTANAQFKIAIYNTAEDAVGNTMQSAYCSAFRTSATTDATAPSVVGSTPESAATDVANTIRPEIYFSEPMDTSTLTSTNITFKRKEDQANVSFSVQVSSDSLTARLTPSAALTVDKTYTLTVLSEVEDIAGIQMGAPWAIEFTTSASADSDDPSVILVDPAPNSADNSIKPPIRVVFSEVIDPSTIHTGTIKLTPLGTSGGCPSANVPLAGSTSLSFTGLEASFFYDVGTLCRNTEHELRVVGGSSGIKDLATRTMAADYTANFYTSKKTGVAPVAISLSPGGASTGIGTDANAYVEFNTPIDPTTVTTGSAYISASGSCPAGGGVSASVVVSTDGTRITIDPASDLTASTAYQINLTTGIKDPSTPAVAIAATCTTFTTGSTLDSARPSVSSTNPSNGATGWLRWESPTVTFSEPIDLTTVNTGNVELVRVSDSYRIGTHLQFDTSGKVLTINPVALLDDNALYRINLKPSIRDVAGYALDAFTQKTFTTVDTTDTTAPTVSSVKIYKSSSYSVTCGATNVDKNTHSTGKELKVYFSKPIDPDIAISGIFALIKNPGASQTFVQLDSVTLASQDSDGPSPGTARSMVKLKSEAALSNGTNHRIQIRTQVVDDANNPLAATYTCDFST